MLIDGAGSTVGILFYFFIFFKILITYIRLHVWRHGTPSAIASGFKGEGQLIARPLSQRCMKDI